MTSFDPQVSQRLALHLKSLIQPGNPLLLTNIHDPPTASLALSHPKTRALATASFAIAAQAGLLDEDLDFETNLTAISRIRTRLVKEGKAESVPLTADLQNGYGERLKEVIERVVKQGVVGCNLEDSAQSNSGKTELISAEEHVERIKEVLSTAAALGVPDFVVNARTDCVILGGTISEAIARGKKYLEAGATTVFVWGGGRGLRDAEVKQLVEGLDGKLNVILRPTMKDALSVKALGEIGVSRISMGPGLWREGMAAMEKALGRILEGIK